MHKQLTNSTSKVGFLISAFPTSENGRLLLSAVILLLYLIVLIGNILILTLVCLVTHLHTSMYFFLCNLSVLDNFYVSTTLPKLLYIYITGDHYVSYNGCLVQLYLFMFFADTESFLLVTMAIDRFVAICFPLHYTLIMSKSVCVFLALPPWVMGAVNSLMLTVYFHKLKFSGLRKIDNFFCDIKGMMSVSYSDTTLLKKVILLDGMFLGTAPLGLILTSYACIIATILKIKSSAGRKKAFSSCTSHITIVLLYYGSAFCLYLKDSPTQEKYLALIFVTLVPMLNPVVYSLRNKDIKRAIQITVRGRKTVSVT